MSLNFHPFQGLRAGHEAGSGPPRILYAHQTLPIQNKSAPGRLLTHCLTKCRCPERDVKLFLEHVDGVGCIVVEKGPSVKKENDPGRIRICNLQRGVRKQPETGALTITLQDHLSAFSLWVVISQRGPV